MAANETSVTLPNLKYSTRYKFYFNALTQNGPGPTITEEAVTVIDEGKLSMLNASQCDVLLLSIKVKSWFLTAT